MRTDNYSQEWTKFFLILESPLLVEILSLNTNLCHIQPNQHFSRLYGIVVLYDQF